MTNVLVLLLVLLQLQKKSTKNCDSLQNATLERGVIRNSVCVGELEVEVAVVVMKETKDNNKYMLSS